MKTIHHTFTHDGSEYSLSLERVALDGKHDTRLVFDVTLTETATGREWLGSYAKFCGFDFGDNGPSDVLYTAVCEAWRKREKGKRK